MSNLFVLKYRIPDDAINALSGISAEDFDKEYGDIEGQIEMDFNGKKEGFVNNELPFGRELLVTWIKILNLVVKKLNISNYVAFIIPEMDSIWVEFIHKEGLLRVRKVKDKKKDLDDMIITSPSKYFVTYDWDNVVIDKNDFTEKIMHKTKEFIHDISVINKSLLDSQSIKELVLINQGHSLSESGEGSKAP